MVSLPGLRSEVGERLQKNVHKSDSPSDLHIPLFHDATHRDRLFHLSWYSQWPPIATFLKARMIKAGLLSARSIYFMRPPHILSSCLLILLNSVAAEQGYAVTFLSLIGLM